ncbi:CPBP family intramembrane glutamic endopeptidase [Streptococcus sp. Marseille-Q3533]|uniref:CPBP family intramembrane glutamic endopeptidase n=1 Tax=Streptococcus sp. Marseille-Q3533 TaxID=2759692 RepID=UPI0020240B51|nr:CPBP family intramembrane glutamic endopeptidase [Streptococcus sp. Marseille-Q3533]
MVNELQRIISAFIQILFIILLPSIWWFVTVRGKVPFMEWIGLKAVKRDKVSYLITWIIGGFLLFTAFSIFIFPLTRSIETATSAFSGMGLKALPSILIYSFLQTSLPEELLFRGFLLKRLVNHMPFVFANTIQAIAFGLLHGVLFASVVSLEVTFFIIFFTGAIAVYLGFVNEKKAGGSILTSWIIHALANILSGLVAAFSLF